MKKPRIAFLVNGSAGSPMGIRALAFAEKLGANFDIEIIHRSPNKILAISRFFWYLVRRRPNLCYVYDVAFSAIIAAAVFRLIARCPMVIDTGDAIYELSRSTGRGRIGMALTWMLEQTAYAMSDHIVVRSDPHQELLQSKGISADVIPDGVDTEEFHPASEDELRRRYQLQDCIVIGLLGTLVWSERWQMCYGWELIEVIRQLEDQRYKGLIIGDGTGLAHLRNRCEALGISDRVVFLGRVPYHELPKFVNLMDICLSTQTNDVPGRVRTTGKLPIYLACGRFVMATNVGQAARVLPPEMLLDYEGTRDTDYPRRLAERIECVLERHKDLRPYAPSRRIATEHFEYRNLAPKLQRVIETTLSKTGRLGEPAAVRSGEPSAPPGTLDAVRRRK